VELSEKLSDIRIKFKIEDEYIFQTNDGFDILKEDEKDYLIEDSLVDNNKIILKKNEKKVKLNTPAENSKSIGKKNNLELYLYPVDNLTEEEQKRAIVLMVVGQTGSGKTTLLNAYINYLMGINYEDDFRYIIIFEQFNKKQDESQTSEVTIYNIRAPDGTIIQIIDTPGFGDTGGIKKDIEITQKIRQAFIDKLTSITCICFVAQSCNARLSANQKYIFNCILDLFGDDVKSNFICMLTFCDGAKPVIIDSLQSKQFMFHEIIPYIETPWYYKFNNSGIFEKDIENEFNLSFFNLGMKSFKDFTQRIKSLKKISLNKSKEVLLERQHLEKQVEILQIALKEGIDKVNYIKGIINMIKSVKGNLNGAKNFTKKIKTYKPRKIPVYDGRLITTCLVCSHTCHDHCYCEDNEKWGCAAMTGDRNNARCVKCKGKCHWTQHKNLPYIYQEELVEETVTLDDLKKLYYDSKSELDTKTQLIQGAKKDLIELNRNCLDIQDLITKGINRLKEIALNKSVFATSEEYIDLLIQTEQSENKPGYEIRIEGLKLLKNQKKTLREIYERKNNQLLNMNKFIDESLQNEYKIDDVNETNCCIL
jgi:energy-coupling factor transporter ATP-binding protein EcfA2